MSHFPPISPESLTPFNAILAQGPEVLEDPTCPYPDETKRFLKKLFGDQQPQYRDTEFDVDEIGLEVANVYESVRRAGDDVRVNSDPKDKVAILKMQAGLLEKMVNMKEQVRNLKWMSQFQSAVTNWIDENLTPAQRSEFISHLGSLVRED